MSEIFIFSLLAVACLMFLGFYALIVQVKKEVIHNTKVEGDWVNQRYHTREMQAHRVSEQERRRLQHDWYHSIDL